MAGWIATLSIAKTVWRLAVIAVIYGAVTLIAAERLSPWLAAGIAVVAYFALARPIQRLVAGSAVSEGEAQTDDVDPELENLRGLGCEDGNAEMLLVDSPVGAVAGALAGIQGLESWIRDGWGQQIRPADDAWVVFRIQGHAWTVVARPSQSLPRRHAAADALSRALDVEVIELGYSDTAGVAHYTLFAGGRRLEDFYSGESWKGLDTEAYELSRDRGVEFLGFTSKIRQLELAEIETHGGFVDAFLRDRDAYAPPEAWRNLAAPRAHPREIALELVGLSRDTCVRIDYLAS